MEEEKQEDVDADDERNVDVHDIKSDDDDDIDDDDNDDDDDDDVLSHVVNGGGASEEDVNANCLLGDDDDVFNHIVDVGVGKLGNVDVDDAGNRSDDDDDDDDDDDSDDDDDDSDDDDALSHVVDGGAGVEDVNANGVLGDDDDDDDDVLSHIVDGGVGKQEDVDGDNARNVDVDDVESDEDDPLSHVVDGGRAREENVDANDVWSNDDDDDDALSHVVDGGGTRNGPFSASRVGRGGVVRVPRLGLRIQLATYVTEILCVLSSWDCPCWGFGWCPIGESMSTSAYDVNRAAHHRIGVRRVVMSAPQDSLGLVLPQVCFGARLVFPCRMRYAGRGRCRPRWSNRWRTKRFYVGAVSDRTRMWRCGASIPSAGNNNPSLSSANRTAEAQKILVSGRLAEELANEDSESQTMRLSSSFTNYQEDPLVDKLRTQLGVIHPIPSPPMNRNIVGFFVFFFFVGVAFDKVWTTRKRNKPERCVKNDTWPQVPTSFSMFFEKDLQRKESVEWVNMVLGKLWKVYRSGIENWIIGLLQPVIDNLKKPSYVQRVEIKQFSLGDEPLSVRNVERRTSRRVNDLQ
ncbi:hypothetical protein B296_00010584 [Ensete ventricosum]|uniref:SMP-LTD domain-containing protein n=1 Tax=Ensete ventricosum TaxID=4639 RepID=A0A427A333_ENSVE|nr:hypothetical protein B296_00010584 [Ensete ventricosum]